MADLHEVVLDVATLADATVLSNLLELYIHDLSAAFPSIELGADGRFGYSKLPLYCQSRNLETVEDARERLLSFDGSEHKSTRL